MSKTISFASLFSGIGGADLGLQSAGLEHAWGLEYEAPLAELYTDNIGRCFVQNILDANPIKFDKVDWLHASPVCKAFSTANTNKGERQLDLDCAQKTADFIKVLEPRWVSIENVEAYRKSKSFHLICDQLGERDQFGRPGYWFKWGVLNAANFGVPQARRRLILIACKSGFLPELLQPEKWNGWHGAIEDLLADLPDSRLADWQIKKLPDALTSSMCGRHSAPQAFVMSSTEQRVDTSKLAHQPCFTLKANDRPPKAWLYEGRVVQLDIKCLARLQSFPDTYRFSGTKSIDGKGIGNSVCPSMMKKIAQNILGVN